MKKYQRATMDAELCKQQIGLGALMAVGAHNFLWRPDALIFNAKIHPINANGERSGSARKMLVEITKEFDLYRICVYYLRSAKGQIESVIHFETTGIYNNQLSAVILSLDSGTEKAWL